MVFLLSDGIARIIKALISLAPGLLHALFIAVGCSLLRIPNDPEKPFVTSGVRLGTAAVTTRGLQPDDMDKIAECIYLCATDYENSKDKANEIVESICNKYPLYE